MDGSLTTVFGWGIMIIVFAVLMYLLPRFLSRKVISKMIWMLYGIVLIMISVGVIGYISYLQPKLTLLQLEKIDEAPYLHEFYETYDRKTDTYTYSDEQLPDTYLIAEWEFLDSELVVNTDGYQKHIGLYPKIIIDKSLAKGSPINVKYYETPTMFYDFDLSESVKMRHVQKVGDTIVMESNEEQEDVSIMVYQTPLTASYYNMDFKFADTLLYIKAPVDSKVQVTDDSMIAVNYAASSS